MQNTDVKPLVSIIVTVYNVEKYLPKCLDSIINQTYKNLEIICVNNGSEDSSVDNAGGFAEGISKVYESQELYSKMQSENLKKVKDFDIGVINEKMRKIYSD